MNSISNNLTDSMVSDDYEVYCIEEVVNESVTQFHSHDFYEIHITLSGEATFYINGDFKTISAGTILLIDSGDLHRICAQQSTYFERLFIYITPQYLKKRSTKLSNLDKCFEPIANTRSKVLNIDIVEIMDFLKIFSEQQNTESYGDDLLFEQALINLIIYINKRVINDEFVVIGGKKSSNQLIDNVIYYVNQNLSSNLSLYEVASQFFISKYHLSHKFKEITNMTFNTFVNKKRLNYSKQLLRSGIYTSEVYIKCGFSSYSYFLKAFKKEFGITPKEFTNRSNKSSNLIFNDDSYR